MTRLTLPAALLLSLALACGVPPNPDDDQTSATGVDAAAEPDVPAATASDPTPASAAAEPLVIAEKGFDGVMIGVPLAEVEDRLTLEHRGAAGGFDAYGVTAEAGMRTATVFVNDASEVARIVVTNTEAETTDNLGVGSSFADLRTAYGTIQAAGFGPDSVGVVAGGLRWILAADAPGAVNDDTEVRAVVIE